ncbi:tetratricopeptide repeat protein [Myxococcota bacterium]|nr:tetratricopeptide repeat protein [Myxococcota bacterium]
MKYLLMTLTMMVAVLGTRASIVSAQNPPIYKSIYDSAKAKYEKGEYVEARALFLEVKRMALEDETYSEMIDYRIALCLEREGNFKEAIKSFKIYANSEKINDKIASLESVEAKIRELEAKLAQETNKTVELEKAKKTVADLYKRADDYATKGNLTSALALYQEVKDLAQRASIYQEIIDFKIAYCYHQQKDYVNAIKHYRLYIAASSIQKGWPDRARVQKHILDLEKYLEKEESSTSSLLIDAKSKALWAEGQNLYRQNQIVEARKRFIAARANMKAISQYQEWIEYYIGLCYEAEGKHAEAVESYKLYTESKTVFKNMPSKEDVLKAVERLEKSLQATTPSKVALQKKLKEMLEQARRLVAESKPAEARQILEQIKQEATAANLYTHKMDWDIGVTYDREGNYKLAVTHYKTYLNAPAIQPGWPDRYSVQNRVQFLQEELNSKGGGTFSGGGSFYGDGGGPGILGPADSITGKWWFWVGVAVVGVIVIGIVFSGQGQATDTGGGKSRPLGFGGDPVLTPGIPLLRF